MASNGTNLRKRIFRPGANPGDTAFRLVAAAAGLLTVAVLAAMVFEMTRVSMLSIRAFGWRFIASTAWDPVAEVFGSLPFVYGTIVSSLLALMIAVPISLGIAIFLSEFAGPRVRAVLGFIIELLAAVPSVIFGLWGIFLMVPWLRDSVEPGMQKVLGFLPFFSGPKIGFGLLAGALILAIMILPTISSVSREVLRAVPNQFREGALALGATRWETVRSAVLPYAASGIIGAIILGLGRALGETMAVTMVIGNRPEISASLFAPSYTMASVIANEYTEATSDLYLSSLTEIGLILFGVTLIMNIIARLLVWRVARGVG